MKKMIILTNSCGSIPQKIKQADSISVKKIREYLTSNNIQVEELTYDNFISEYPENKAIIKNSFFYYASSQYPQYYSAFEDVLHFIDISGGILIPAFSHFKAHENKFFQELIKLKLGIRSPESNLITTIEEGLQKITDIKFPVVAKLSSGYGSSGVSLIKSKDEAEKFLHKNLVSVIPKRKNLIKYKAELKYLEGKHPLKVGKIIFQEYIKGSDHDWKIIIFGNRIFYLKRYFKENDFRASGSGNFDNTGVPEEDILRFAVSVRNKLDTPWVSLDIIKSKGNIFLIEYQCLHFGLYTVIKSREYLEFLDGNFIKRKTDTDTDLLFAEELLKYMSDPEKKQLWK